MSTQLEGQLKGAEAKGGDLQGTRAMMTAVRSASKRSNPHANERRRDRLRSGDADGAIATAFLDLESAIAITGTETPP
jgi:hypothetical protein